MVRLLENKMFPIFLFLNDKITTQLHIAMRIRVVWFYIRKYIKSGVKLICIGFPRQKTKTKMLPDEFDDPHPQTGHLASMWVVYFLASIQTWDVLKKLADNSKILLEYFSKILLKIVSTVFTVPFLKAINFDQSHHGVRLTSQLEVNPVETLMVSKKPNHSNAHTI